MDFRMLSSLLELPSPWNGDVCTFQDAFRELAVSGNVTKFLEDLNANVDIYEVFWLVPDAVDQCPKYIQVKVQIQTF